MREIKNTIWLGVWLVALPFLGIPSAWKEWLVILTGAVVLAVSFLRLRQMTPASAPQKEATVDADREQGDSDATGGNKTV